MYICIGIYICIYVSYIRICIFIYIGSKVKFQFGANSEEPSMKKSKNEKEVNENEKKDEVNDLMDDLEGDDGEFYVDLCVHNQ
jgi:hypothetical protein